jgi:hypothetical protein
VAKKPEVVKKRTFGVRNKKPTSGPHFVQPKKKTLNLAQDLFGGNPLA